MPALGCLVSDDSTREKETAADQYLIHRDGFLTIDAHIPDSKRGVAQACVRFRAAPPALGFSKNHTLRFVDDAPSPAAFVLQALEENLGSGR